MVYIRLLLGQERFSRVQVIPNGRSRRIGGEVRPTGLHVARRRAAVHEQSGFQQSQRDAALRSPDPNKG